MIYDSNCSSSFATMNRSDFQRVLCSEINPKELIYEIYKTSTHTDVLTGHKSTQKMTGQHESLFFARNIFWMSEICTFLESVKIPESDWMKLKMMLYKNMNLLLLLTLLSRVQ